MATSAVVSVNLGFLAVQRELAGGYVGGYLVTNLWGRPLEFRLSSPVLPSKIQQILYGPALEPYLCGDLIGKKLLEKTTTPAQFIFTDQPAALDLRLFVEVPVGLFLPQAVGGSRPLASAVTEEICCHVRFEEDVAALRSLLERLGPSFDMSDPFQRIREALAEARKLGVANRAA